MVIRIVIPAAYAAVMLTLFHGAVLPAVQIIAAYGR